MDFEALRRYGVSPIIRSIDHYQTNRNKAYMLEFRVGKGSVLVSTLNVLSQIGDRIEAGYLLECLVDYATGDKFAPSAQVPKEEFVKLFTPEKGK